MFWRILIVLAATLLLPWVARAQFGSFTDTPVDIIAEGGTRFENGVAIAERLVQIHYQGTDIYADYAEYNPETRDVLVSGNVRIYYDGRIFNGYRAVYNLESKQLRALDFDGGDQVLKFNTLSLRAPTPREFRLRALTLTTSDRSQPDYRVRARSARIYPNDRAILSNATLYAGQVPVFWFPYLYTTLDETGYEISPGYNTGWGAFALLGYRFPLGEKTDAKVRFDVRSERGVAVGAELKSKYGPGDQSFGKFRAYYANDTDPNINDTGLPRLGNTPHDRYIVSFKNTLVLNPDIYATFDINSISDQYFLQDYFPAEYIVDPQPDNNISANWLTENFQWNLLTRWMMNDWQEVTARLPEFSWNTKQTRLFGLPVFYDGTTAAGYLQNQYPSDAANNIYQLQIRGNTAQYLQDYSAFRFDTFHQLSYPRTFFGWLSLVPRIGFRGTYYSRTGYVNQTNGDLVYEGQTFRPVLNAGFEASFKLSKRFEQAQSRNLGLDGLLHVVQPFLNLGYTGNYGTDPARILQFDRLIPNTQLPPLDYPQFTSIDAIETNTILRLGVRQRLITRRDNDNFQWFSWESFLDVNFDNPYQDDPDSLSNLYNNILFSPVPWFDIGLYTQLPVAPNGFTDLNTVLNWSPAKNLSLNIGHRYMQDNPYFQNSSLLTYGGYLRINDNWGFSVANRYEFEDSTMESQRYMIHRDLSSWIISVGALITDDRATYGGQTSGQVNYGFLLMFTLKDAPQVSMPLAFDVLGSGGSQQP